MCTHQNLLNDSIHGFDAEQRAQGRAIYGKHHKYCPLFSRKTKFRLDIREVIRTVYSAGRQAGIGLLPDRPVNGLKKPVYLISGIVGHRPLEDYFMQLAVAKLVGITVLLAPVGPLLKEWAYAGFAFTFTAAFVNHSALHDSVSKRLGPLVILVLLAAS